VTDPRELAEEVANDGWAPLSARRCARELLKALDERDEALRVAQSFGAVEVVQQKVEAETERDQFKAWWEAEKAEHSETIFDLQKIEAERDQWRDLGDEYLVRAQKAEAERDAFEAERDRLARELELERRLSEGRRSEGKVILDERNQFKAERDRLAEALAAADRESAVQMQSKLDAQSLLANIVEAIGLSRADFDLNDTWRTVGPRIIERLAEIVDAAGAAEAERDRLREEIRIREESQIPMIPRGAKEKMDRLEAERDRLRAVVEAARDPFLVLLESHPDADGHVNAEMARAAQRLRAALAALEQRNVGVV
jgi:hypothetical protein